MALLAAVSQRPPATGTARSAGTGATLRDAEAKAREALGRAEREHGAWSPELTDELDALAKAIDPSDPSRLAEARALAERSLEVKERAFGASSAEVALGLLGYVQVLNQFRQFAEALPLAERSLAMHRATLGPRHKLVGTSHYQLADVLMGLGDLAGARRHFEECLGIWEETLGPHSPPVSDALHRIAYLRAGLGDPAGAMQLIERSLSIREKAFGPWSSEVAASLIALGNVHVQLGDRGSAMPLYSRAQAVWERALGPEHPWVARSLTNQATLLAAGGDIEAAMRLLERALELRRRAFGESHHLVASTLIAMGSLLADTGRWDRAEPLLSRALAIQQESLGAEDASIARTIGIMSRLSWQAGRPQEALARALRAERMAREHFLRTSSGLSEEEAIQYESVRTSGLSVALSAAIPGQPGQVSPLDEAGLSVWDEVMRSRALALDMRAGRHSHDRSGGGGRSPVGDGPDPSVHDVARSLPDDTALLSYIVYDRHPPPDAPREPAAASYAAMLIGPQSRPPVWVPLGPSARIDTLIQRWREEASADPRLINWRLAESRYMEAAWKLREVVWEPLSERLAGARQVLVVPDGALATISFSSLPDPEGRFLVEDGPRVHYLSAESDLLRESRSVTSFDGLLALGGPDFDADPPAGLVPGSEAARPQPACPAFDTLRFDRLPGARLEAQEVGSLWALRGDATILTGPSADEATFKKEAPRQRSLHLATHAFFLDGRCRSTLDQTMTMAVEPLVRDSPLLLSGLALAGANRRDEEPADGEDGILTAEEIARMDLSSVEWVVLSGCETGLGRIVAGEGVLGLRRAFETAGAGTLVMSLWPVEDGAARLWMQRLYRARAAGLSALESVTRASREMLAEQRSRGRTSHPFFWGGFVSSGGCASTRCPAVEPRLQR